MRPLLVLLFAASVFAGAEVSNASDKPDLTEATLDFLARTIGK